MKNIFIASVLGLASIAQASPSAALDATMSSWLTCTETNFNVAARAINEYRQYGLYPNKPISDLSRAIRAHGERITQVSVSYNKDMNELGWSYRSGLQPAQMARLMKISVTPTVLPHTQQIEYADFRDNMAVTILSANGGSEVRCEYDAGML